MINYYEVLNICNKASLNEVKKAYKIEALKWHPDRNKLPNATERMQLINEAYLILKDNDARLRYDREYTSYQEYLSRTSNHKTTADCGSAQQNNNTEEYVVKDELLKEWVIKAKRQAATLAKQSLDDLLGISRAATKSAWDQAKGYILLLIVVIVISNIVGAYK